MTEFAGFLYSVMNKVVLYSVKDNSHTVIFEPKKNRINLIDSYANCVFVSTDENLFIFDKNGVRETNIKSILSLINGSRLYGVGLDSIIDIETKTPVPIFENGVQIKLPLLRTTVNLKGKNYALMELPPWQRFAQLVEKNQEIHIENSQPIIIKTSTPTLGEIISNEPESIKSAFSYLGFQTNPPKISHIITELPVQGLCAVEKSIVGFINSIDDKVCLVIEPENHSIRSVPFYNTSKTMNGVYDSSTKILTVVTEIGLTQYKAFFDESNSLTEFEYLNNIPIIGYPFAEWSYLCGINDKMCDMLNRFKAKKLEVEG